MKQKDGQPVQVTFQLVGPLLRQIIDDEPRPAREVAVEHVSVWLTATRIQLYRFRKSLNAEFKLFTASGPTQAFASQRVRIDEHFLLASASNLQKALKRFAGELPELSLPEEFAELLRNLRNVYEHWEEYMPHVAGKARPGGSGTKLKAEHPKTHLWSIEVWPGQDVKIARVLSLRELQGHLRTLSVQLKKLRPVT